MLDLETQIDFPLMQRTVLDGYFNEPDENGEFARGYMRVCDLTQYAAELAHVQDYLGRPWSHKIYCNWIMIAPLQRVFGLIVSGGLAGELRTYDGCFNVRPSKSGKFTSMHAWGLAVDFNAASNGYGADPTMSPELVKCFAECGFEWGGLWQPPGVDGMHFQLPWVKIRIDSNPLNPVVWVA